MSDVPTPARGKLKPMRHCWNCGEQLGRLSLGEWEPGDTCGSMECNRASRDAWAEERAEAHRKVDEEFDRW